MNFQMRTRVYNDTQSYLIFGPCLQNMLRDRTLFWNLCPTGKESVTYEAFHSLSDSSPSVFLPELYHFPTATVTNYHNLGGLNNTILL